MSARLSVLFPDLRAAARGRVTFSRVELGKILNVYSVRVAGGEWRDYAIDHIPGLAVFSIFRHTLERPYFSIVKFRNAGDRRYYEYAVFQGPKLLRRSDDLENTLRVLDRKLHVVARN
jgi:hypothetical protein